MCPAPDFTPQTALFPKIYSFSRFEPRHAQLSYFEANTLVRSAQLCIFAQFFVSTIFCVQILLPRLPSFKKYIVLVGSNLATLIRSYAQRS